VVETLEQLNYKCFVWSFTHYTKWSTFTVKIHSSNWC